MLGNVIAIVGSTAVGVCVTSVVSKVIQNNMGEVAGKGAQVVAKIGTAALAMAIARPIEEHIESEIKGWFPNSDQE